MPTTPAEPPPDSLKPTLRGAGCLRRLMALLYDSLLVLAVVVVVLMPVFGVTLSFWSTTPPNWLIRSLLVVVTFTFYVAFWTRWGRTLGSQCWRMRIINSAGQPPTLRQAALRYFVSLPSLFLLVGYLWVLVDRHRRSWPDIASGTLTIHLPPEPSASATTTTDSATG